jgi:hypothetical protein
VLWGCTFQFGENDPEAGDQRPRFFDAVRALAQHGVRRFQVFAADVDEIIERDAVAAQISQDLRDRLGLGTLGGSAHGRL